MRRSRARGPIAGLARRRAPPARTPLDASTEVAAVFARAANLDATLIDLASDPVLGPLDLRVVYLPGLDIVQHSLFGAVEAGAMAPASAAERLKALEQYYVFLDESLAQFTAGSDRLVMLVAEPGRVAQSSAGLLAVTGTPASTQHPTAADTAIAPTVLYALGVPVARDLASSAVVRSVQRDIRQRASVAQRVDVRIATPEIRAGEGAHARSGDDRADAEPWDTSGDQVRS